MNSENPGDIYILNGLLRNSGLRELEQPEIARFDAYLQLILRWNQRINLTSVRDPARIIQRHFVECVACAQSLPESIATVLDFGSGAGFPGIPIAISRPNVHVTLAESQNKKAAFLQEAVRTLGLSVRVFSGRAELLHEKFDCITLRSVDQMTMAVAEALPLLMPGGLLAIMTSKLHEEQIKRAAPEIEWRQPYQLAGADGTVLLIGTNAVPRGTI